MRGSAGRRLFADEDEMEKEFRGKAPCVSRKRKRSLDIKSNREALQTAEKLEYAWSTGNEKISQILFTDAG